MLVSVPSFNWIHPLENNRTFNLFNRIETQCFLIFTFPFLINQGNLFLFSQVYIQLNRHKKTKSPSLSRFGPPCLQMLELSLQVGNLGNKLLILILSRPCFFSNSTTLSLIIVNSSSIISTSPSREAFLDAATFLHRQ